MGNVELAVLIGVVFEFVTVSCEKHIMELAFGEGFASADIDVLGVGG